MILLSEWATKRGIPIPTAKNMAYRGRLKKVVVKKVYGIRYFIPEDFELVPWMKKKLKKSTVSQLKKKLDKVFSIWIRKRDRGVCFTCGIQRPVKQMQAGHYISRSHNSTRFDPKNVHCQCVSCNIFRRGAMDSYALALQRKYGLAILQELDKKKWEIKRWTIKELENLIEFYSWQFLPPPATVSSLWTNS